MNDQVTTKPKINRGQFLWTMIGISLVFGLASYSREPVASGILAIGGCAAMVFFGIQRFRSIGASMWWVPWLLVPVVSLVPLFLAFTRQEGYSVTKSLDRTGKIAAWVFAAWVAISIAIVVVSIGAYENYIEEARAVQQRELQGRQVPSENEAVADIEKQFEKNEARSTTASRLTIRGGYARDLS